MRRFAGIWVSHSLALTVQTDGQAIASWRVYKWCGPGVSPPCDTMRGSNIDAGGQAKLTFTGADGASLKGQITGSNVRDQWPIGSTITFVLQPYGLARLFGGNGRLDYTLCGPDFANAPPDVARSVPCGA